MFILPPYGSLIFYFSLGRLERTNIFYLFNINFSLDPLQLNFVFSCTGSANRRLRDTNITRTYANSELRHFLNDLFNFIHALFQSFCSLFRNSHI